MTDENPLPANPSWLDFSIEETPDPPVDSGQLDPQPPFPQQAAAQQVPPQALPQQPVPPQPVPPQPVPQQPLPPQPVPPQPLPQQSLPQQSLPLQQPAAFQQVPQQAGPQMPGYQQAGPVPFQPKGTGLDQIAVSRQMKKAPEAGWRKVVFSASGGRINPGDSKEQLRVNALIERVRQPIRGDFRLAVLSLKGGVGKTTTTIGLGATLASLRGDRVIAVDANPDLGTLAERSRKQTNSTVRDLLKDPNVARYADVRSHTSQAGSRLEVLASERDPAVSEAFSEQDYRDVVTILRNHYNIILTDCGTGLMHSAMKGVLDLAHGVVLVTSPALDGAQSASTTLDWLTQHGYGALVAQAVVVVSSSKPGRSAVDTKALSQHFLGKVRAVQEIPYDRHLAEGAEVDLELLGKKTRTAFIELGAIVADAFPLAHER